MKKNYLTLLLLISSTIYVFAQTPPTTPTSKVRPAMADSTKKDTSWKVGGFINIQFGQVSLSNWAAGGQNSLSLSSLGHLHANYKSGKWLWANSLDVGYGLQSLDGGKAQKTDDHWELSSNVGYQLSKAFYLSILFDGKSQFAPGYNYTVTPYPFISGPFSPAYFLLGTGITYNPNKDLILYLSPATAKMLIVDNQTIANLGTYGNTPAVTKTDSDGTVEVVTPGKNTLFEFGAYFSGKYSHAIVKNVNIATELDLFSNYLNNPQDLVVNWNVLFNFKVNKFLSASIATQLIYDNSVRLPTYNTTTGLASLSNGPRTQFKEVFSLGFNYIFGKK